LLLIVRRSSGSLMTWRRAEMVCWAAQGMDVAQIAKWPPRHPTGFVRVLHNFNDDGFEALVPNYAGGRPPRFTLPVRREIRKIALARPVDHGVPFWTWNLSKLAEFLVAWEWSTTSVGGVLRQPRACANHRWPPGQLRRLHGRQAS
jgi:transposase